MWPKEYKDYPVDTPLIKESVETGKGIVGCEMRELNGWGNTLHIRAAKKQPGLFARLIHYFKRRS